MAVIVQLEDGRSATLTRTENGVRVDNMDILIDYDQVLDEELEYCLQDNINQGHTSEFAKFSTLLFCHFDRTQFEMTPFLSGVHNEFEEQMILFERIMYELWKTDSRIFDGDSFVLSLTDARCPTLGTAVDIPNNVEVMITALLAGRN